MPVLALVASRALWVLELSLAPQGPAASLALWALVLSLALSLALCMLEQSLALWMPVLWALELSPALLLVLALGFWAPSARRLAVCWCCCWCSGRQL